MANRMNKVRALTGGLAAIMIMSNMATVTTFAAEPEVVAIEQAVEATQEASEVAADETAVDEEALNETAVDETVVEETTENTEEVSVEETTPVADETTENTEEVPVEETTPVAEETTENTEEAPVEETTPVAEETTENTEEVPVEETTPLAEETTENTEEAPVEETTPVAEETTENTEEVPAEETTPVAEETGSEETVPVDETASVDVKEIEDKKIIGEIVVTDDADAESSFVTIEADAGIDLTPVVDPTDIALSAAEIDEAGTSQYDVVNGIVCNQLANGPEATATAAFEQVQVAVSENEATASDVERIASENEATASDIVLIASDTEGIAHAGNIEEDITATDSKKSDIPGGMDEEALKKSSEYQANRILRETTEGKVWNTDYQFWMNNTYYLAEQMTDGNVYITKVDRNLGEQTVVDVIPTEALYAEGVHGCSLMDKYDSYKYNEKKAEEEEKAKLESAAKENLNKISEMDILEIQDYCKKLSTVNTKLANGTYQEAGKDETEEEKTIRETIEVLGIDMVKEALGTSIDKAIDMIPGADFVGGPVKDLLKNAMGLKEEEPDVLKAINEQTKILENKLDDIFKKLKEGSTNAVTAGAYGTTLNNWETSMNNAKDSIKRIDSNKDYNDVDKLVRYASIIGGENDWNKADNNIITQMKQAAQVLIGGSQVDPKERSLYDLAYDSQKDECLFAGEAMQKCEKYVQDRTNRFVATCNVFIECLNVHKQVADLTQEQVDSMNSETRKLYDSIKSSKESINTIIDDVLGYIFRGYKDEKDMTADEKKDLEENGKGVFAVATDYYNKDKTVYIDTGNKYVDLKDKLTVKKPSEYFEYGYYCENVTLMGKPTGEKRTNAESIANKIYDHVNRNMSGSGLTTDDISKIRDQAKKNGMTIKEYLAYCGFDVSNLEDGILVRGAYKNNHAAGASGYHVGTSEKIGGSGHDCKKRDGRMVDWFKVFDLNKNNNNPWIGREDYSGDWYYFFEME